MTVHAIAGLVALNLLLLGAGAGVLWAARGWSSWLELLRLAGLAYLLGVAAVGSLLVLELVVAISFGLATVVLTALGVLFAGIALGRVLGRRMPPLRARMTATARGWPLLGGLGVGIAAVYLEAQFRAGRTAGLFEWDAMAFWVPKAKAIYYFGGLDERFFATLPGPSYPPLLPALEASAFEFMGGVDPITLHLMLWFPLVAFVAAVAGLLAPRVRALALWPPLLLVVLAPVVADNGVASLADLLLDYFLALAALLVALWLVERERWQLLLAALFLTGAMLTKREGLLLGACVVVAAMAASWRRWRTAWPALVLAGAVGFAITRPWHHWFASRGIATGVRGEAPEGGLLAFVHHLDRAWPSLELTLKVLFDGGYWLIVPAAFLLAIAVAALARAPAMPLFTGSYLLLATLGCSWVIASFPDMPITTDASVNPIVRLSGGLVLPMAGLLPLLLEAGWQHVAPAWRPRLPLATRALGSARLGWAVVAVAALAYPTAVLAGGAPHFRSSSDCEQPATHDGEITLVLGRFDSIGPAQRMVEQVVKRGFVQAHVIGDACGEVKVGVPGYPTLVGARDALREARRAGLPAVLEQG